MNTSTTATTPATTPATVIEAANTKPSTKAKAGKVNTKASIKAAEGKKASTKASTKPSTKAKADKVEADTAAPKPTKMSKAIDILKSVYADETIEAPRRVVVARFREELNMKSTTASTYVGLVQSAIMNAQSELVQEKVERAEKKGNTNPSVFSAFRTGSGTLSDRITFVGTFITRDDAIAACKALRLPITNHVRGVVAKGQQVIFPERKTGKVEVLPA